MHAGPFEGGLEAPGVEGTKLQAGGPAHMSKVVHAAVNHEFTAYCEGGFIGGEIDNRFGYFSRGAERVRDPGP